MSYIQDKLNELIDTYRKETGFTEYDARMIAERLVADYHNHIVEKILHYYQENILYIGNEIPESLARISDMDRYVMLGLPADIQKILQDTNKDNV